MSQWGTPWPFVTSDGGVIRVTPHVAGPGWEPLADGHKIDDLIMTSCSCAVDVGAEKLAELKREWIGRPYRDWAQT